MSRVLLVNGDDALRERNRSLLQRQGCEVWEALDGGEGLALARKLRPQILLSGLELGELDGIALAIAVRADPELASTRFIIQTQRPPSHEQQSLSALLGVPLVVVTSEADEQRLLDMLREDGEGDEYAAGEQALGNALVHRFAAANEALLREQKLPTRREGKLQAITDALPDLVAEVDHNFRYSYVNAAYERWHGVGRDEVVGREVRELLGEPFFSEWAQPALQRALAGESQEYESSHTYAALGRRDIWVRYLPHFDEAGEVTAVFVLVSDITARKVAERSLTRANRAYKCLLDVNQAIIRASDERLLLEAICQVMVKTGQFELAWFALAGQDGEGPLLSVASAARDRQWLEAFAFSLQEGQGSMAAVAAAIFSGQQQQWVGDGAGLGLQPGLSGGGDEQCAMVALPLLLDGAVYGAMNIYSCRKDAFEKGEISLLSELADDVVYGLRTLRMQQEQQRMEEALRRANRAYRTLLQVDQLVARSDNEEQVLSEVCSILTDEGGYRMAWIGYPLNSDGEQQIHPVASGGHVAGYFDTKPGPEWGEGEAGCAAAQQALSEGKSVLVANIAMAGESALWQDQARQRDYHSAFAIPLLGPEGPLGVLVIYAASANTLAADEIRLLEDLASDLSFGVCALRNQKEREQAEQALERQRNLFEAVFRHIPDAMLITDNEQQVLLCNSAIIRDFGYVPEELVGRSAEILYDDFAAYMGKSKQRIKQGGAADYTPFLEHYRRKDGSLFPGETVAARFSNKDGEVLGCISVIRDVSERIRLEEERRVLQRQLQQAQKMEAVGHLTGGIAHDFNNILASILGYVGLALNHVRDTGDDKVQRYLDEVQKGGERARDLVAQLLAFGRQGQGEPELVQLSNLLYEVTRLLKPTLPATIQLSDSCREDIPPVLADPVRLHQVLMNLCINARDAMRGRGRLELRLGEARDVDFRCASCHQQLHGNYVTLSVRDSGGGIAPGVLEHIFEPFYSTKEVGKGTGMGLAMVHGIVHEMGGHVLVETSASGSTFHLLLPPASLGGEVSEEDARYPQLPEPKPMSGRIMVVDDEVSVGGMIGELLEQLGLEVTVYDDAQAAHDAMVLRPNHFDLVITDQTMPGVTGKELARSLLRMNPSLPIILSTGYSEEIDELTARQMGIRGYLPKPFEASALIELVRQLLDSGDAARAAG